ncbi:hypothetical protein CF8_3313 [Nocardioides sp. CF8]|uniref:hypothetical protein n=1 Tax=Nocardioides sp. CF8 TaxID=110319 RepID=UPI00032F2BD1|nr:hypothetical protein [Nocardioides sp. CF8]EON22723.1 hypothetical protein CF8_3313 [Nocardioides sp. CF8]
MGDRWLPYAAAALASGASALIMGVLILPSSGTSSELIDALKASPDRWLMASAAFMYAAVGLTLGIPAFLHLLTRRGRATGQFGAVLFSIGTIGLAGYAALLILFRALTLHSLVGEREIELLSNDPGLRAYVGAFVLAFQAGLVVLAVALLMAGSVQRWIPVAMMAYAVVSPFARELPEGLRAVHILVLGTALIAVAVSANEAWSGLARRAPH